MLQVADGPRRGDLTLLCAADAPRPRAICWTSTCPGLNGLEVLSEFHRTEVLGSSKVIILTARPGAAEVLAAFECGGVATSASPPVFPVFPC